MSTLLSGELESALNRLGRAWLWILAFGVISVVVGVLAILWPGATIVAIAIIFALQLIVAGVFRFVAAFSVPAQSGWLRALWALVAILSFVVGVYLLRHVNLSVLVLAIVLGAYWTAQGVVELFVAIGHSELPGRAWMIVSGVLSIIAGVIVALVPLPSLFVLTLILGFWLIIFGGMLIGRAFHARSDANRLRSASLRPSGA